MRVCGNRANAILSGGNGSKYGPVLALSDDEPVQLGFTLDSKELRFG
jgi:hypothetical protein